MKKTSGPFLKALINQYHKGNPEPLVRRFPTATKEILELDSPTAQDITAFISLSPEHFLLFHPNWIIPLLRKLPTPLQKATIASISEALQPALCDALQFECAELPKLGEGMQITLRELLWVQIKPQEVLPLDFLPESSFTQLLMWTPELLSELVDLLGLYDLALTLRFVVDKKRLQSIHTALTPAQQQVIRRMQQQREILKVPIIDLSQWNGSPKWLLQQVHRRGLLRLGRILHGQSSDLLWYLTHRFDIPQAQALLSYAKQECPPQIHERLMNQFQEQIQYLQNKITT